MTLTPEHYLKLTRYNAWANRRAAEMVETLSAAQAARPLLLLSHVLRAERVWLERIQGLGGPTLELWQADLLTVCQGRIEANTALFEKILMGLEPEMMQLVSYANTKGTLYTTPLAGILDHVFTHGTHHRGQLALLVRDAGQVPQPLDLIVYLRLS